MPSQKELKALIERKHPDFDAKKEHWDFLQETYESPRSWFSKHIFQFTREGDETFKGRQKRAYRFNHTREVVDLVNKYLFKSGPMLSEDAPEHVKRFRARATLSGLTFEQFTRQVSRKASIAGRVYVVVDNNAHGKNVVTVADEKNGQVRLYAYIVMPSQVKDMGFDADGNFAWVLIQEVDRDDDDPFSSTGELRDRYRLWTKNEWYLFEVTRKASGLRVEDKGSGVHNLGVVPVIKCDHIESDNKYSVPALIEDIAYLDRTVANYCSNLDQIINDQTFSQLVIPAQAIMAGVATNSGEDDTNSSDPDQVKARRQIMKMGTSQILIYDGEHGSAPAYISPDPRQANLIISTIKQIINEIYHTVGLAGERTKQDNSMGIDNSSGVAKAFDFERVNALLASKAHAMEAFSNRLERLVRIFHGEKVDAIDNDKPGVRFSTNFDVRGLNDELAIAAQLSLLAVPMEIRRQQLENIVDKMWPMLPEEKRENMRKAIESWQDSLYSPTLTGSGQNPDDPLGQKTSQGFPGETPNPSKE